MIWGWSQSGIRRVLVTMMRASSQGGVDRGDLFKVTWIRWRIADLVYGLRVKPRVRDPREPRASAREPDTMGKRKFYDGRSFKMQGCASAACAESVVLQRCSCSMTRRKEGETIRNSKIDAKHWGWYQI